MLDAVLFHNNNSLEFEEVRHQVLRIPEVIAEIRRAQLIWDESGNESIDLMNYLNSDDAAFFQSGSVKEVVLGVVQMGLFKRYVSKHGFPKFIVGETKNVSPVLVATGQISFEEMLLGSRAVSAVTDIGSGGLPSLRGQLLPQYKIFTREEGSGTYTTSGLAEMLPSRCLRTLAEEHHVRQVISIGPGAFEIPEAEKGGLLEELICHESIDMDPLLSWFWPQVRSMQETA